VQLGETRPGPCLSPSTYDLQGPAAQPLYGGRSLRALRGSNVKHSPAAYCFPDVSTDFSSKRKSSLRTTDEGRTQRKSLPEYANLSPAAYCFLDDILKKALNGKKSLRTTVKTVRSDNPP
jgi:hypothetical protein